MKPTTEQLQQLRSIFNENGGLKTILDTLGFLCYEAACLDNANPLYMANWANNADICQEAAKAIDQKITTKH
jgi:hypothetical protein